MTDVLVPPTEKPPTTLASEQEAREVAEAAREKEWQAPSFVRSMFEGSFRLDLVHPFPQPDPAALVRDALTLAVQVNGKLRATIEVAPDTPKETIEAAALAEPNVAAFVGGQVPKKVIVVPGKIVNIVV